MRCNLHCEFCYVGDLLNIEGEWREELTLDALRRAFPDENGFRSTSRAARSSCARTSCRCWTVRGEGLRLRLPHDERHDHHRGTGRGAGGPRLEGVPEAHSRVHRRPARAARRGARAEGHVRSHDRRACGGCRRRRERKSAPLRVSINTTVAHESLDTLDQMVDVAEDLGIEAIGLNHLMYSTPQEVTDTVQMIGTDDRSAIATFVTHDPLVSTRAGARRRSRRCATSAARAGSASTCGRRS